MGTYFFGTRRLGSDDEGFADALAVAHEDRQRPRCLCVVPGIEMYVARFGDHFIVKRMPGTGSRHASQCPSYEPPAGASGLGQVLGSAIKEDLETGETALRLGFSMCKLGERTGIAAPVSPSETVASDGSKLSLRGLLHYLWDQAELTRWQPGFAGKRSWGTVRKHLLLAAENKVARGEALRSLLYIPEPFAVEQRAAINARRIAQWRHAMPSPGQPQRLMLLIGEVKEIVPARYGRKVVIKHVPDQGFAIDEQFYRRLGRHFETELTLWGSDDRVQMIIIATFAVSEAGIPAIGESCLAPVTPQWVPIEDSFERQLVERLVTDQRTFIKGLRYNLRRHECVAFASLLDTGDGLSPMFVVGPGVDEADTTRQIDDVTVGDRARPWVWRTAIEPMPPLPWRLIARTGRVFEEI